MHWGDELGDILFFVVPCFNEEDILPVSSTILSGKIDALVKAGLISPASKILFVDDGSTDRTWAMIKTLHEDNSLFLGISLAHNSGEQNAYLAGLMTAKEYADFIITIDADLQDDINAVDAMIAEYRKGSEIVYGVRSSRKHESFFKKMPAQAFYAMMKYMGTELIANHSQYRLMSRRAVEALAAYHEVNMFLPALVPLLGFQSTVVLHERKERAAGKSKYSVRKLYHLAAEAVTSFSMKPLRVINILGALCLTVAAVAAVYAVVLAYRETLPGWLAVLACIWAVGGAVLLSMGIIGEYTGKMYAEAKRRPRYFVSESLFDPLGDSLSQPTAANVAEDDNSRRD